MLSEGGVGQMCTEKHSGPCTAYRRTLPAKHRASKPFMLYLM